MTTNTIAAEAAYTPETADVRKERNTSAIAIKADSEDSRRRAGAPIKNAGTLVASIALGGAAVDGKTRVAAYKAAQTPEQRKNMNARKAAALKAKRNAAK